MRPLRQVICCPDRGDFRCIVLRLVGCAVSHVHYCGIMNVGGHQMLQFDDSIYVAWACIVGGSGII